ncbi:MAG: DNA translocase FtsK 4TM domain-containing protein [Pseudomonadota bacterium]
MKKDKQALPTLNEEVTSTTAKRIKEGIMILLLGLALYLWVAIFTYHHEDPSWVYTGETLQEREIYNSGGKAGAWLSSILLSLLGYLAFLIPICIALLAMFIVRAKNTVKKDFTSLVVLRVAGLLITCLSASGLLALHFADQPSYLSGGLTGQLVIDILQPQLSLLGSTLVLIALFLSGFTLGTGFSWLDLMEWIGAKTLGIAASTHLKWSTYRKDRKSLPALLKEPQLPIKKITTEKSKKEKKRAKSLRIEPTMQPQVLSARAEKERQVEMFSDPTLGELPAIGLLDPAQVSENKVSEESLNEIARLVELRLADFGVQANVVAVNPGPVITRFELDLAPGIKVAKISNLAKDLARALSVISVRVVEVIPGKSTIGLELPNESREMVRLSEVIASKAFDKSKSYLTMGMGKDISGHAIVVNLAKMPHCLVAGTTGSGKSVGLNAMILSLLYKCSPEQLRLVMIDPKMLELSVYEGIPHLLAPVVTDMKEAANALRWCVGEMERRYKLMSCMGVRNLAGFNRKVSEALSKKEPIQDPLWKPTDGLEETAPFLEELPAIVVVIDELADMMMIVGKKVEELIARIAQKARAAGIHLVLATQRPSVDVLTGLIKANIPTRIAFQVSSKIDSRTILDQPGAEQLLGQGDMLYQPAGTSVPTRIHGAFVDDDEVHRVVQDWKKRGSPQYIEDLLEGNIDADVVIPGETRESDSDTEQDPLYDKAVAIVIESRKASISGVQRRLKIGYNRAARMIEEMEAAGVVSEMQSNGTREVLAPPALAD